MSISKLSSAVADRLRTLAFRFRASDSRLVGEPLQDMPRAWRSEEWIPLTTASRILYEELDGTPWRGLADRETSAEDRLNYMAGCLVRIVPIEGRSPSSGTYRAIRPGDFEDGIIKAGGHYFQRYYESYLTFVDMRVRTADLLAALERMKAAE